MLSTNSNQVFTIKSATAADINNIVVNKGTANYSVTILAESTNKLKLSQNNPINLQSGSLIIGSNIAISPLSTGEYTIPQNAKLQIAGGSVTNNGKIIVNGELDLGNENGSSGTLNCSEISLQNNSNLAIYGGEATVNNISVSSTVQGCTFLQNGGTLNCPTINIESPNATFTVGGGTMYIQNFAVKTTLGAITGGHTIINKDGANINTQKDFWDLNITKNLNFSNDLIVLNNLTVADGVTVGLNGSAKKLTVGGNFIVGGGGSFSFQPGSLITLNGKTDAYVSLPSTFNPTELKIDKATGHSVILNTDVTLANDKDLTIESGILNTGANSITVSGNVVNNGEMIGSLNINGNSKKISGTGEYGTIVQNVTTVNLGSNITANTYTFNDGKCYLNAHVIKLHEVTNGGPAHYFVNNGDKASAGLRLLVNGGNYSATDVVATWPVGTSTYYAPASITAKENATFISEYITIGAVGKQHPCLKTDKGDNLPCYWKVESTGVNNGCLFTLAFQYKEEVNEAYSSLALLNNSTWVESDIMEKHVNGEKDPDILYSGAYYRRNNTYYSYNRSGSTYQGTIILWADGTGKMTLYNSSNGYIAGYRNKAAATPYNYTTYGISSNTINFHNCSQFTALTSGDYTAGIKANSEGMRILRLTNTNLNSKAGFDNVDFNSAIWTTAGSSSKVTPAAGDICIIDGFITVEIKNLNVNNVGKVILVYRDGQKEAGRLQIGTSGVKIGSISGMGEIQFMKDGVFDLDADCSLFDANDFNVYHFSPGSTNNYHFSMANHDGAFPNVTIEQNADAVATFIYDKDLYVRNRLNVMGNSSLKLEHDIYCGTLAIGGYGGGGIIFTAGKSNVLEVGDIDFDYQHNISSGRYDNKVVKIDGSTQSTEHNKLIVTGNIINKLQETSTKTVGLDLYNNDNYVELWFEGDKNQIVDVKTSNFKFKVKQMIINKEPGSSIKLSDKKVELDDSFASNSTDNKSLVMKSGEVIFDVDGQVVPLSTGGDDFVI
ncbi:MAG: hypothetical protein II939_13105, partial [Bacteroidales bacterium]|nr:hypothetical protein [Bacteroidales bacterium]